MQYSKYFRWLTICLLVITGSCFATTANFSDENGTAVDLNGFKGKTIIFLYMSARCHYCKQQVLELNKLLEKQTDKVKVFGVFQEQFSKSNLQNFKKTWRMNFNFLVEDPSEFLNVPMVTMFPMMLVRDKQGVLSEPIYGVCSAAKLTQQYFK